MEIKKAAVIGYPIKHSLSPIIHNSWIENENIKANYQKIEIKPQNLENFLLNFKEQKLAGVNITVPHKEEAYKILKNKIIMSDLANKIEAINTLYIKNGQIYGDSTDYYGFKRALLEEEPELKIEAKKILIIGAGGAAKAVIFGLLTDKAKQITVINRTEEKAIILKEKSNNQIVIGGLEKIEEKITAADIIINTTSCGLNNLNNLKIDHQKIKGKKIFYDIVYKPLLTKFLCDAKENNHKIITGINMLIYQALPAFNYFFDIKPKITETQKKIFTEKALNN
ncbi:MAG: shikimate dehydrogenase [Alphaproteobacteria bacterium]|jgi:shikimate dehydrogenase|nr:shikimate dehydrogenase [Alphaproteobacteria bacterium]